MKKEILVKFGKKVREERVKQGLSQEQLASRAGVHRTYVGMIERAEKNITLENIEKVSRALKIKISDFFETEDTILYAAAFDANGGVFEPLLTKEDAIISDSLNHASIIDGVRLCKAARYRYQNHDMADLEKQLIA